MLNEFPPPHSGKTGWPWIEETSDLAITIPDDSFYPKISIVTPSYNQAQYLEETIRSVLLQNYPNLEYIVIDGGSTDGSVEIIKKYKPWLTYWVSEKDKGQAQAINKGFARSTGEIMAWINSDDYYLPGIFKALAKTLSQNDTQWLAGNVYVIQKNGVVKSRARKQTTSTYEWLLSNPIFQPGVFWRRSIWVESGGIDEDMHYSFDYDLWMKFIRVQPCPTWLEQYLAIFRIHDSSKTGIDFLPFERENQIIHQRYDKKFSRRDHFQAWKLVRERQAEHYLSIDDFSKPLHEKIILGVIHAPWLIFTRYFYYKIKRILLNWKIQKDSCL
ncbi:MAG: glycosyltransferase [Chloroflexi bacterium HGW-Chloroflexi-6]|nr:MAG: glycosyltransferase [Chloroflexi bacterium HGW-Chloroflexi-6]